MATDKFTVVGLIVFLRVLTEEENRAFSTILSQLQIIIANQLPPAPVQTTGLQRVVELADGGPS
jgi:hypothetical protein